jgi:hypothetical protein
LGSVDPKDGAKSIELCRTATDTDRKYGVISAAYVRADGAPNSTPGLQVGIKSSWGANVKTRAGTNLLALSSGHARAVGDPGACNAVSCITNQVAKPPTGFPQNDPTSSSRSSTRLRAVRTFRTARSSATSRSTARITR